MDSFGVAKEKKRNGKKRKEKEKKKKQYGNRKTQVGACFRSNILIGKMQLHEKLNCSEK